MRKDLTKKKIFRVIDANLNRSREGLRVCEDVARFILDDRTGARKIKLLRQKIFTAIKVSTISYPELLKKRNTTGDVGKASTVAELKRDNWQAIFFANIERVKESTRVLEEFYKIIDTRTAGIFKNIRFGVYEAEKQIIATNKSLSCTKHNKSKK